jgi:hypothetical protein
LSLSLENEYNSPPFLYPADLFVFLFNLYSSIFCSISLMGLSTEDFKNSSLAKNDSVLNIFNNSFIILGEILFTQAKERITSKKHDSGSIHSIVK